MVCVTLFPICIRIHGVFLSLPGWFSVSVAARCSRLYSSRFFVSVAVRSLPDTLFRISCLLSSLCSSCPVIPSVVPVFSVMPRSAKVSRRLVIRNLPNAELLRQVFASRGSPPSAWSAPAVPLRQRLFKYKPIGSGVIVLDREGTCTEFPVELSDSDDSSSASVPGSILIPAIRPPVRTPVIRIHPSFLGRTGTCAEFPVEIDDSSSLGRMGTCAEFAVEIGDSDDECSYVPGGMLAPTVRPPPSMFRSVVASPQQPRIVSPPRPSLPVTENRADSVSAAPVFVSGPPFRRVGWGGPPPRMVAKEFNEK